MHFAILLLLIVKCSIEIYIITDTLLWPLSEKSPMLITEETILFSKFCSNLGAIA